MYAGILAFFMGAYLSGNRDESHEAYEPSTGEVYSDDVSDEMINALGDVEPKPCVPQGEKPCPSPQTKVVVPTELCNDCIAEITELLQICDFDGLSLLDEDDICGKLTSEQLALCGNMHHTHLQAETQRCIASGATASNFTDDTK